MFVQSCIQRNRSHTLASSNAARPIKAPAHTLSSRSEERHRKQQVVANQPAKTPVDRHSTRNADTSSVISDPSRQTKKPLSTKSNGSRDTRKLSKQFSIHEDRDEQSPHFYLATNSSELAPARVPLRGPKRSCISHEAFQHIPRPRVQVQANRCEGFGELLGPLIARDRRIFNYLLAGPLLIGRCLTESLHLGPLISKQRRFLTSTISRSNLKIVSAFCYSFVTYQLETLRLLADNASSRADREIHPNTNEPRTHIIENGNLTHNSCPVKARICEVEEQLMKPPAPPRPTMYSATMNTLFREVRDPHKSTDGLTSGSFCTSTNQDYQPASSNMNELMRRGDRLRNDRAWNFSLDSEQYQDERQSCSDFSCGKPPVHRKLQRSAATLCYGAEDTCCSSDSPSMSSSDHPRGYATHCGCLPSVGVHNRIPLTLSYSHQPASPPARNQVTRQTSVRYETAGVTPLSASMRQQTVVYRPQSQWSTPESSRMSAVVTSVEESYMSSPKQPVMKSQSDKGAFSSKHEKQIQHNLSCRDVSSNAPLGAKVEGVSPAASMRSSKLQVNVERVKSKRSPSPGKLSLAGARRRLWQRQKGLSSLSVQRSEEVVPLEVRHLVRQHTTGSVYCSKVSESPSSFWIDSIRNPHTYEPDVRSSFVEGLGAGQIASRQALVSPYLGDIQISLYDQRGMLEVEIVRARCLRQKVSAKSLPSPFVKVYLMKDKHCLAKFKTRTAGQTLDPLYQEKFLFRSDYLGCILQVIVWGDYGRGDRKSLMGILQIQLANLDLSNLVLAWYKLLNPPSMADSVTSFKCSYHQSALSKSGTA